MPGCNSGVVVELRLLSTRIMLLMGLADGATVIAVVLAFLDMTPGFPLLQ